MISALPTGNAKGVGNRHPIDNHLPNGMHRSSKNQSTLSNVSSGGTLVWTAPEVMAGMKYTEKADVYRYTPIPPLPPSNHPPMQAIFA